jgi:hypothetical protein
MTDLSEDLALADSEARESRERVMFEEEYLAEWRGDIDLLGRRPDTGEYAFNNTRCAWLWWQKARAALAPAVPPGTKDRRAQPDPAAPARAQDRSHAGIEWSVSKDGLRIESDYFHFDAVLKLSGDFTDEQERKQYADSLAAKLNAPDAAPSVAPEPLKGWKMNHVQFVRGSGKAEIGYLDSEDDRFSPVVTVDTGLYYEPDQAHPLAVAILGALQAAHPPREASVAPEPVIGKPDWDLWRTYATGPSPHSKVVLSVDDFHKARAVFGTEGAHQDAALYRGIQAYVFAHPPRAPLTDEQIDAAFRKYGTGRPDGFAAAVRELLEHGIRGQG